MGWDAEAPQPISLYTDLDFSGYTSGKQIPRPLDLSKMRFPNRLQFHQYTCSMFLP